MSTSPGTSPNQARNSRFAAGNDKMGSAPASSISRLTDQIHRPVLASALRIFILSASRGTFRDRGTGPRAKGASGQGCDGVRGQFGQTGQDQAGRGKGIWVGRILRVRDGDDVQARGRR